MKALFVGAGLLGVSLFFPHDSLKVIDVIRIEHKVVQGFVCRSQNDIQCVDNICNDQKKGFWAITVNGDYKHFNSESIITPADRVTIQYLKPSDFKE